MGQQAAAQALLGLLQNPSLPKQAHVHVLFNAVQLLEQPSQPPLFSVADTRQLITLLQVRGQSLWGSLCRQLCPASNSMCYCFAHCSTGM